ncbi:MAG: MBL fold metallo-hydrolase, partial [Candidatus Marinimicrobia bacterium]|nr:MBL fold metallo-hydrolase [Candidatus Neomarinimicrobiota bacterium]
MIIESIVTGSFMENAWILGNEESKYAIIFDPGDNVSNIIGKMNELDLTPVFILNTHTHPDHLGAAAELQKRFDLPFAIHEDELPTFNSAKNTAQFLGLLNFQ